MYGSKFADMWSSADAEMVKQTWAEALQYVSGEQIKAALRDCLNNNPWPPSLPEFVSLCRAHYKPDPVPQLTHTEIPADPKVVAEIARLAQTMRDGKKDSKDWARRIIKRHSNGEKVLTVSVEYAREALGIKA